jgi:eukaryotic-like serine/threonine-protein kinase
MLMLAARYRLGERVAVGGMGSVYVATDARLGRKVAVKLLKEELATEADFVERFRREAHAAAALNHPNIAQVYDYGQDGRQHFIVMELVPGVDLSRLLKERGRLSPDETVHVVTQVCGALSAAHAAGIVHRDIKPANVIVDQRGHVKVTDFGIARTLGQPSLTHSGALLGTAQYLSPEQARGQPAGPASDLYSLGIVLFQMLTGGVPFAGESPVAIALRHLHEDVPSPSASTPGVPPALDEVVLRATAKEASERFQDAGRMADALAHALAAPGTAWLPVAGRTAESAHRVPRRRRMLAWAAGAAALAAVAAAVVMAMGPDDTPSARASSGAPTRAAAPRERQPAPQSPATPSQSDRRPDDEDAGSTLRSGPVVPPGVIGADGRTVEETLKARGYKTAKADVASVAPRESVVATVPRPGQPVSPGQTVVLLVSNGHRPEAGQSYLVPAGIVGANAHDVEERLKAEQVHVKKVPVDSGAEKDTVLGSYPAPGTTADGADLVLLVSSGHAPK